MRGDNIQKTIFGGAGFLPKDSFVSPNCFVSADMNYRTYDDVRKSIKFLLAGPRE
jgi:hypothetical protein